MSALQVSDKEMKSYREKQQSIELQSKNAVLQRKISMSVASKGSGKNSLFSKLGKMFIDSTEFLKKKYLIEKLEKNF